MDATRHSLLLRIRDLRDDHAWQEFHSIYAPFLYRYARKRGLGHDDAEEVRAACLEVIARQIAGFEYQREKGGFRNWLRRIVTNKVIDALRKRKVPVAESQVLSSGFDGFDVDINRLTRFEV